MATTSSNGSPKVSDITEAVIRIAGNSQDGIRAIGGFLARLAARACADGRAPRIVLVSPIANENVAGVARVEGVRVRASGDAPIETIPAAAPPGTTWAIGTELHLVKRLEQQHPEQTIRFLSPVVCMCATMYRIDLAHLCWSLEHLEAGTPVNVIRVDDETARWAVTALERMLAVA